MSEVATKKCQFNLAQDCLQRADDFGSRNHRICNYAYSNLIFTSNKKGLVLLASANGNADLMSHVAESSKEKGQNNISFLTYFMLGK